MKILVFGNSNGMGGSQTAFRRLIEVLFSMGHELAIIGVGSDGPLIRSEQHPTFSRKIPADPKLKWKKLQTTILAGMLGRRFAPNLFISVGLSQAACVIARCLPKSTFCVAQDFIFGRHPDDNILRKCYRSFNALAVQAPSMLDALKKVNYTGLPVNWLPCFPDLPQAGYHRAENKNPKAVRLSYFGRLAPNKGIDLLLHGLAAGSFQIPVSLDIWGGGAKLESLITLRDTLGLQSNVAFKGFYPDGTEMASLFCSYDGLVLPSIGTEGLPLILLEAMAYGIPYLTTKVGAIPDCCKGNPDCVLVDPTRDAVRSGLELITSHFLNQEFSTHRLQEFYNHNFSVEAMTNRWSDMLSDPKKIFKLDE